MKKEVLFVMMNVLMATSPLTLGATRSVGYKLWDSNNGITATTDPTQFDQTGLGQEMHVQIKFDGEIRLDATQDELKEQFAIRITSYATPEDAGRSVVFDVDADDPTVLNITLASIAVTAQTNSAITVKAVDEETGLVPGIKDADGNAVRLVSFTSVQPTGIALEEVSSVTGTATVPASVVYRMSSVPLVRGMNFLQARSNRSSNPDGYLAREMFTIHSHSFYTMTALTHFTTLTSETNRDTLQKAGYRLELLEVSGDAENPQIRLIANTPVAGEQLSWVVYHYPYRSPADRKFELAQLIGAAQTDGGVTDAARAVLYDDEATAEEVLAAIRSLQSTAEGIYIPEVAARWSATAGNRSLIVRGATAGDLITVYRLDGTAVASFPAKSAMETIPVPSEGVYLVRTGGAAVKVPVR